MIEQESQVDDAIPDDQDWCPECGGDDVIDLPNGDQFCKECRHTIEY